MPAERRVGELLKELARATPQTASPNGRAGNRVAPLDMIPAPTPYAQALADNAISRQSAHRYEQLADVPQDAFDEALRAPDVKPSTTRIIAQIGVTLDPSSKWQ